MKKIIALTIMVGLSILLSVNSASAAVAGSCANCHTMHNSQGGEPVVGDASDSGASGNLTKGTCVGCHTGDVDTITFTPYVNSTSAPTTSLAGGNFYWVTQDDAKGHNVKGIPNMSKDDALAIAPGYLGSCTSSCHETLYTPKLVDGTVIATGCQGCHLAPKHHATRQAKGTPALEVNGYFRFLSGHSAGHGVEGIEDSDWQYTNDAQDHNEYLGEAGGHTNDGGFVGIGANTMTAYCTGCHGNFHVQKDSSSASANWIRHPSDAVLPDSGEYLNYTIYDPDVPVAREDLTDIGDPALVNNNSDMVMCLSCHRAHGSPYDDLLRWDYNQMIAGGGENTTGCFKCHSGKD